MGIVVLGLLAGVEAMANGPTFEQEVVKRVNDERSLNGALPPLKEASLLSTSAEGHSLAMATRNFFSHCDLDTKSRPWARIRDAGYSYRYAAENIAAGYPTPKDVVAAWMSSSSHRANILSRDLREIGVGYVYDASDWSNVRRDANGDCAADGFAGGPYHSYWTQNFGARDSVFPIVINREAHETDRRQVALYLYGAGWASRARIRNENGAWSDWMPFATDLSWQLSPGKGEKQVFVELMDAKGTVLTASDKILFNGSESLPDADGDGIPDAQDPDDDNDGIADWADPSPTDPKVAIAPVLLPETQAQADQSWTAIDAPSGYLDAVVIAGPPTRNSSDPGVVRLRSVSDTGFELRFQEWDYRQRRFGDTKHVLEDIPYLVLQPGRHTLSDGSVWEAGTFDLGGTGVWQSQSFTRAFSGAPVLFLTIQTENGAQAVAVRARHLTATGFEAALFEEEALMDGHAIESIGYLAIASPNGGGLLDLDGLKVPYLLQSLSADERWTPVLSQRLSVEEEQSVDSEVDHIDEQLNVLAIGDQLLAQQVSSNGGDPAALRRLPPTSEAPMEWGLLRGLDHRWQTLPFAKRYSHPVLIAKPVSSNGLDPGVIRLRNLGSDRAELRYQEWTYLDGIHGAREDLFYLVAEAGSYTLGGLEVQAERLSTHKLARAGQWAPVALTGFFTEPPVVLSSVLSYAGSDPVITRIRDLDAGGFGLAMDEQESKNDGHVTEQLGWVAIAPGSATTSDGRKLDVFFTNLTDKLTTLRYPRATSHRFATLVGDIDTTLGADPVFLRHSNPTAADIALKLAEEQSKDGETGHVVEQVGIFVGE